MIRRRQDICIRSIFHCGVQSPVSYRCVRCRQTQDGAGGAESVLPFPEGACQAAPVDHSLACNRPAARRPARRLYLHGSMGNKRATWRRRRAPPTMGPGTNGAALFAVSRIAPRAPLAPAVLLRPALSIQSRLSLIENSLF